MDFPDRQKLYHIIDSEGENFFVQADSFSEAEQKFRRWDAGLENDLRDNAIESIVDAGYLIKEFWPRDASAEEMAEAKSATEGQCQQAATSSVARG